MHNHDFVEVFLPFSLFYLVGIYPSVEYHSKSIQIDKQEEMNAGVWLNNGSDDDEKPSLD